MAKPQHCKKHPKYRAVRQPRVDCYECRRFYYETNLIDLRGEFHKPKNSCKRYSGCRWCDSQRAGA